MDKYLKNCFGNYTNSIRTSGEVVDLFIRDKEVICKLVFFIGANLRIFFLNTKYFYNKFKINCLICTNTVLRKFVIVIY